MDIKEKNRVIRQRLKTDFIHYAQKCLKIRTKQGAISPFILNRAQRHIHACLERQLKETGRVRALVLKGRQQGCSTYVEGRFYWKVTHRKGVRAFILTHLEEATRNIYGIARRFHDHCPPALRPGTSHSNARELVFNRLDSGYRVGTAKSQGTGRSDTLQYFHGSEVAYWANAESHVAGALQAVPDLDGTEIILESTSDGPTGLFYQMCKEAEGGNSPYQLVFVPWYWQPEYSETPTEDFSLTAEEEDIMTALRLSPGQMFWRRKKIAELGSGWIFRREYPASIDEAFASDRPGALWQRQVIDNNRIRPSEAPEMARIVIAIDPAVTSSPGSDETGIVVAGLGTDGHGYILEDLSGRYTPSQWAEKAAQAFYRHKADRIIAESNQGGDMVEHTLRTKDPSIPFRSVTASRGKRTRAEPVAALDEQGRIHHVGHFSRLEDQMCRFETGTETAHSPDRVDARVWAISDLMLRRQAGAPLAWQI